MTGADGVRHRMWVVADAAAIAALTAAVDALPALYIADGHHRSAAAARVAAARAGGAGSHQHFLAVLFPDHQMTILAYNRLLRDLNGRDPAGLLDGAPAQVLRSRPPRFRSSRRAAANSACSSPADGTG